MIHILDIYLLFVLNILATSNQTIDHKNLISSRLSGFRDLVAGGGEKHNSSTATDIFFESTTSIHQTSIHQIFTTSRVG